MLTKVKLTLLSTAQQEGLTCIIVEKLKLSTSIKAVVEAALVSAPGTLAPFCCN